VIASLYFKLPNNLNIRNMSAEAGPSVEKKEKKPKRMVDGREETKEERKARKAAKREVRDCAYGTSER
jgi:hypothetical protein